MFGPSSRRITRSVEPLGREVAARRLPKQADTDPVQMETAYVGVAWKRFWVGPSRGTLGRFKAMYEKSILTYKGYIWTT